MNLLSSKFSVKSYNVGVENPAGLSATLPVTLPMIFICKNLFMQHSDTNFVQHPEFPETIHQPKKPYATTRLHYHRRLCGRRRNHGSVLFGEKPEYEIFLRRRRCRAMVDERTFSFYGFFLGRDFCRMGVDRLYFRLGFRRYPMDDGARRICCRCVYRSALA